MAEIKRKSVDIIIPIYNALEDLKKCASSIIKYTDLSTHRLILIDDKSSDYHVHTYLASLKQDGVYVYENDINIGFSGTVNKGMLMSEENDVLLLNSDTIVTPRWIEKILECAYSDDGIATVSPSSNNASICSVPYSNKNNVMPANMSLDEYAEEIERISMRRYPPIPMANGFCMYIKRKVIKEVGLFDSAAFGRGYGEENDYCNRASELGYRHVLCDDTFIYHKGTASFEDESRETLGKLHEPILEERYPQLNRELEWYWAYQQDTVVHKNIELFSKLSLGSDKKNIFYLIQADFREGCSNNIGGTQLHVKDLVDGLKTEYNMFVAARDGELLCVTAYVGDEIIPLKFYIGPIPAFNRYRDKNMAELYENLLKAFKIDMVHIHHTMTMTLELYYVASRMNIPVYLTLHDYYYICPTLRLLDVNKESCIGKTDWDNCRVCMKKVMGIYENVNYMQKWRKEHKRAIDLCEKIILPSQSAEEVISKYYPEIKERVEIIGHGIDDKLFNSVLKKENYVHQQLHIAFVGGICETKGSEIIYKLISKCSNEFQWHIFGGIDGVELHQLKQKNLIKTGWYKREELKSLLEQYEIDIVCILSTVAETYCYTLSEVVACGVPVIVTDIGALGERMKKMECGWIVPEKADADVLLGLLRKIQNNSKLLEEKKKNVKQCHINTIENMVAEYQKLYGTLRKRYYKKDYVDFTKILAGYTYDSRVLAMENDDASKCRALEQELQMIYSSELYKVMKKIASILDALKVVKRRITFKDRG